MGAHSASSRRMPPMQDVAFPELIGGRAQKMLSRKGRFGMHQRHHILELVAKPECTTGLIKTGSTPEPAAQRLVEQPTVGHQVYRWIGGFDLNCAKRLFPILANAFQRCLARLRPPRALNQILHLGEAAASTQTKTGFSFLAVWQIKSDLHRSTRIQTGSGFTGEIFSPQRCRKRRVTVSAKKFIPISG